QTELSIAFSMKADETASAAHYLAAAPHYLESWGDVELKKGHFALTQPTIRPLFDTRQFQDALLKWTGSDMNYLDFIKDTWNDSVLGGGSFNQALHDGVFVAGEFTASGALNTMASNANTTNETDDKTFVGGIIQDVAEGLGLKETEETAANTSTSTNTNNASTISVARGGDAARTLASATSEGLELTLYSKVGMGDGQQANNPWLQEFPDPITRVSWDNYLTISQADAEKIGVKNWHVADGGLNSSLVELTLNGMKETLPVIIQPGQAVGSIGLSFGYGRNKGLKEEMQTGKNAYKFYNDFNATQ